jgi:predicted SAM-dependent methyltransferase
MMFRRLLERVNSLATLVKKHRRIKSNSNIVKLNLGCGLSVASGWVNIDASLNALFAGWPAPVLRFLYRGSGAKHWYSEEQYVAILQKHIFLHHDLEYGIPFADESIDFIYTSHWLEHLFLDTAERLLRETYRVLKFGGILRVCLPDLEFAISEGNT